eukprot:s94_g43.t1
MLTVKAARAQGASGRLRVLSASKAESMTGVGAIVHFFELPGPCRAYPVLMEGEKGAQIPLREIMSRRKLKKTVLCKYFVDQTCTRGHRCRFAHNLDLLDSEKFSLPSPPPTRLAQVLYRVSSEKEGSGSAMSPGASSSCSPASVNPASFEPWPSSARCHSRESFGTSLLSTGPRGDEGGNLYSASQYSQFGNTLLQAPHARWTPEEMPFRTPKELQKTTSTTSGYIERFVL